MSKAREIKFRAFSKTLGMFGNRAMSLADIHNGTRLATALINSDNVIWMQFTGLKDKNGKEIYEGDILRAEKDEIIVCEYSSEDTAFLFNDQRGDYFTASDLLNQFEVIGNIYENPELLER